MSALGALVIMRYTNLHINYLITSGDDAEEAVNCKFWSLWGWHIASSHYKPILSNHLTAPDELMHIMRSKLKSWTANLAECSC